MVARTERRGGLRWMGQAREQHECGVPAGSLVLARASAPQPQPPSRFGPLVRAAAPSEKA